MESLFYNTRRRRINDYKPGTATFNKQLNSHTHQSYQNWHTLNPKTHQSYQPKTRLELYHHIAKFRVDCGDPSTRPKREIQQSDKHSTESEGLGFGERDDVPFHREQHENIVRTSADKLQGEYCRFVTKWIHLFCNFMAEIWRYFIKDCKEANKTRKKRKMRVKDEE